MASFFVTKILNDRYLFHSNFGYVIVPFVKKISNNHKEEVSMVGVSYEKLAKEVVSAIGGKDNISSLTHCATRLRFVLKDEKTADKKTVEGINGVKGVVQAGGQYQIIIGNKVSIAFEEIGKLTGISGAKHRRRRREILQMR